MTGTRAWAAGGAVVAVLMVVVTWLVIIGPARSDAQALRDDTLSVQQQNQVLAAKTNALRKLAENRTQLETDVRAALDALPTDVALPALNRQLAQQADARGVQLTSISVGAVAAPVSTGTTVAPAGMLAVPLTIQTKGPALAQLLFLRDVQQTGPRAALVSSTSMDASENADLESDSSTTTQLTVFAASLSPGDQELLTTALGDAPTAD